MPQISKQALAQFIRSNCMRQLALNLHPDNTTYRPERQALGMPYPQSPRPGLRQIQEAGENWQAEKLDDLTQTFGPASVVGDSFVTRANQVRYRRIQLGQHLPAAAALSFIVEAEFTVDSGGAFETALGTVGHRVQYQLNYAGLRPDIIEVLNARTFSSCITSDGLSQPIPTGDTRRQLRVIDIKLTAQPSPGYFGEVALYSMALAGWLEDHGLNHDFVVVPNAAVWPGSHQASKLFRIHQQAMNQGVPVNTAQLWQAMQDDLEPVPFEVFVLRVRRFLKVDVPAALSQPWHTHEWHVDNRCSFCEYLGEDRPPSQTDPHVAPHPDHCLPMAQVQDHLSRVAFISQGARLSLAQAGVGQVGTLSQVPPTDPVFETHQALRATRTVVSGRAASLNTGQVAIPPLSGTSASMPRWTDLRLYLSVDFDIGSAITVAFGLKAFWLEPRPFHSPLTVPRQNRVWQSRARIVVNKNLATERHELLAFLHEIHDILNWCQQQDQQTLDNPALAGLAPNARSDYRTKVQAYIWDSLQFDHLTRIIGRHLDAILANRNINYLAWLFPPEELLPNPDLVTRRSPITIVRDVIRAHLAAPIPHYYSLLEVARIYHDANLPPNVAAFNIHPLFGTPLSDQIPSERAHEIWAQVTRPVHWQQQMGIFGETVQKRLAALETVTHRLETDLRASLVLSAPAINIQPPPRQNRVSIDGQLWYAFSKLNAALNELEVHQVRAMPPHERAARFRSARLTARLNSQAEQAALAAMGLPQRPGRRVYELASDSKDVKAKVGDFGFALAPENMAGFLDRKVSGVVGNTPLDAQLHGQFGNRYWRVLMEEILSVSIVGLNRNQGWIAVDTNQRFPNILDSLRINGIANLEQNVIIDPVHNDFFTGKLLLSLRALGNPPIARNNPNPLVRKATGQGGPGARATAHTPVADCLWNAGTLTNTPVLRSLPPVEAQLLAHGISLNQSQWQAWRGALSHRAWIIWGPPGTGKSRTIHSVVVGAVLEAHQNDRPLRVLVSAFTYTAIDNILYDIAQDLATLLPGTCDVFRLRSKYTEAPGNPGSVIDLELNRANPSQAVADLRARLQGAQDVVVVGSTPEQSHNLLTCQNGEAQAEWFDLIVIDEASQMDVAHAILPLCGLADNGSVVLAGDPLQLAPIHQAAAPKYLENIVGSLYAFWRNVHGVQESALAVNYRSNDTLVSFAHDAGYSATLTSQSPDLSLDLLSPLPQAVPNQWPASLVWTPEWTSLLDPSHPAVCFVYDDGRSSQRNEFEADAVAAMLWLLYGHVSNQLRNVIDPATGMALQTSTTPYSALDFWQNAVGVVTPHRAQQGLIVTRLQSVFNATGQIADAIRDAVDTVERFQGQQRDIIIASYTLGDPDQIAEEDEFLMSLNRFNVIASRARVKLVVLVSQDVVSHLARDIDVLWDSRLLKVYAESFCNNSRPMNLPYMVGGAAQTVPGSFRWRT